MVSIILFRRSGVCDPFSVYHEFVEDLLICGRQFNISLEGFADLVKLLGLAPVIEGASHVDFLRVQVRPGNDVSGCRKICCMTPKLRTRVLTT